MSHLKPRIVIGNVKCKQDYHPEDKAFHSSDIPDHARQSRLGAKAWKKPPILGGHKPSWNADSSFERPICERVSSQLITTAYREPEVEPDERVSGWNSTTQLAVKAIGAEVSMLCIVVQ